MIARATRTSPAQSIWQLFACIFVHEFVFASGFMRKGFVRCSAVGLSFWMMGASLLGAPARGKHDAQTEALFSGREVPRLVIEIPDDEMEVLRSQTSRGSFVRVK